MRVTTRNNGLRRGVQLLLVLSWMTIFLSSKNGNGRRITTTTADAFAGPVLICPLAPLAPVWVVGKAAIVARKKFWPDSEPWPREWEDNDVWFEKKKGKGAAVPAGLDVVNKGETAADDPARR